MKKNTFNQLSMSVFLSMLGHFAHAEAFGFDRPGDGFSTAIVPKGHVAWEQSLPTLSYDDAEQSQSRLTVQADMLFRIGLGADTELRLGWDGPVWQRTKRGGQDDEIHGNGDLNVGLKKAINTGDERLAWAVLLQAQLATADDVLARNDAALSSNDQNLYTLGSSVQYQYSDNLQTGITMLYDYQDGDLAWTAIPGIQYKISQKLSGFAEYKYRKQESQPKESVVNNGLIWALRDNLQLDAWVGYSFNASNPRVKAGLGVSYLF
jgi:predicted porin